MRSLRAPSSDDQDDGRTTLQSMLVEIMSDENVVGYEETMLPGYIEPSRRAIVRMPDGTLQAKQLSENRCDFCMELLPKWEVPCENFIFPGVNRGSTGPWGCCDGCAECIRADDHEGLLERALLPVGALPEFIREALREELRGVQELFWQHKTGDVRPWTD